MIDPRDASARARYESLARATRDLLAPRWVETERTWDKRNAKRVYYLSMEFLIGASLRNNLAALGLEGAASEACREGGWNSTGSSTKSRMPGWATGAGATRGLLHRLARNLGTPLHGIRPSVRVRHFPAIDPGRLAARGSGQLALPTRSLGGRPG